MRDFFVDTNVLIGLTFYSDRWFQEVRDAFINDHEIHASELVIYEYCCSSNPFGEPPDSPDEMDIDWSFKQGVFGKVQKKLSQPYSEFRRTIRYTPDEDFSLDYAVEEFIDSFAIRKQAEPQIRTEFEREFEDKAVTKQYINEFVSELIDKIIRAAEVMKQKLRVRVNTHDSVYHEADELRRKWIDLSRISRHNEPDLSIVIDGTDVIEDSSADTLLSGDSDIIQLQPTANEYFDFNILSMADEYSVNRGKQVSGES